MIISNNKLKYKEHYNYFDKDVFLLNPMKKTINSKNDYPSVVWIDTFVPGTVAFHSEYSQPSKEDLESLVMVYKIEDLTYNIDMYNNIIETDLTSWSKDLSIYVNIKVYEGAELSLDCVLHPIEAYNGKLEISKDVLLSEILDEYPGADIEIKALYSKPLLDDDIYDIAIDGLPGDYDISLTVTYDDKILSYFYFDNHTNHRKIISNSYGVPLDATSILVSDMNSDDSILYNQTIFYNKMLTNKPVEIMKNTYMHPNSEIYYEKTTERKILYSQNGKYITIDESLDPCRLKILQYDLRDGFDYDWEKEYSEKYDLREYTEGFSISHNTESKQKQDFTSSRIRNDINKSWTLDIEMRNEMETEFKENIPYKIIYRRF